MVGSVTWVCPSDVAMGSKLPLTRRLCGESLFLLLPAMGIGVVIAGDGRYEAEAGQGAVREKKQNKTSSFD